MSFDNILINDQLASDWKPSGMKNSISTRNPIPFVIAQMVGKLFMMSWHSFTADVAQWSLGHFSSAAIEKGNNHFLKGEWLRYLSAHFSAGKRKARECLDSPQF